MKDDEDFDSERGWETMIRALFPEALLPLEKTIEEMEEKGTSEIKESPMATRFTKESQEELMDQEELDKRFTYHAPKGNQVARYTLLRDTAKLLATTIQTECPDSREKSLAITKIEEAVMWANASIARNE